MLNTILIGRDKNYNVSEHTSRLSIQLTDYKSNNNELAPAQYSMVTFTSLAVSSSWNAINSLLTLGKQRPLQLPVLKMLNAGKQQKRISNNLEYDAQEDLLNAVLFRVL